MLALVCYHLGQRLRETGCLRLASSSRLLWRIDLAGVKEVMMEVHTPTNPYCTNPGCWCHSDALYHDQVLQVPVPADGQLAQAYAFFGLVDEGTNVDDWPEQSGCIVWSSQGGV